MSEGADWVARFEFALKESVFGPSGDLVDQLTVLCVGVKGQQGLLSDQVSGLVGKGGRVLLFVFKVQLNNKAVKHGNEAVLRFSSH